MSSLTGLISGGGGGTPVNGIERLYVGGQTQYTDESGSVWLKTGNTITPDSTTYPDAYVNPAKDISAATYDNKSFSATTQESAASGLAFNNDGTRMYVLGTTNDTVYQYTLSTSFDVSTASLSGSKNISAQETVPRTLGFNNDGSKMYIMGSAGDDMNQYTLSTPFQVNTATFDNVVFDPSAQDAAPVAFTFNNDGTKLYILGSTTAIYQYSLSTAFDVSTASYDNISGSPSVVSYGLSFNSDGTRIFISNSNTDAIDQYNLSTPFDISTISYVDSLDVSNIYANPSGISIIGEKFYYISSLNDTVYQFTYVQQETMGLETDTGTYDYVKLK